jgi:hypothetical protein
VSEAPQATAKKRRAAAHFSTRSFGNRMPCAALASRGMTSLAKSRTDWRAADELADEGLVEFIGNPKHRRSKLVRLTPKGHRRYRELNARFLAIASTLGAGLSEADIRRTREIVRRLSDEVKGRSERPS